MRSVFVLFPAVIMMSRNGNKNKNNGTIFTAGDRHHTTTEPRAGSLTLFVAPLAYKDVCRFPRELRRAWSYMDNRSHVEIEIRRYVGGSTYCQSRSNNHKISLVTLPVSGYSALGPDFTSSVFLRPHHYSLSEYYNVASPHFISWPEGLFLLTVELIVRCAEGITRKTVFTLKKKVHRFSSRQNWCFEPNSQCSTTTTTIILTV